MDDRFEINSTKIDWKLRVYFRFRISLLRKKNHFTSSIKNQMISCSIFENILTQVVFDVFLVAVLGELVSIIPLGPILKVKSNRSISLENNFSTLWTSCSV